MPGARHDGVAAAEPARVACGRLLRSNRPPTRHCTIALSSFFIKLPLAKGDLT